MILNTGTFETTLAFPLQSSWRVEVLQQTCFFGDPYILMFFHDQTSLCDESLRELGNPGASGEHLYLTSDDLFFLKTVSSQPNLRYY